jgi:hypothetical protein
MAAPWIDGVEDVQEIDVKRPGTPFNHGGHREYVRRFRVRVSNKLLTAAEICFPGHPVPRRYERYRSMMGDVHDWAALCVRLSADTEHDDDWQYWIVTADFSTNIPTGQFDTGGTGGVGDQGGSSNKPEDEPPDVEWDYEVGHWAPPKDLSSPKPKPFLNSAGQPYVPAEKVELANAKLIYSRNESTWLREDTTAWAYVVNSDEFLGARPGMVLCLPPKAKLSYRGGIPYYRVTYQFRFHPYTDIPKHPDSKDHNWQYEILDTGLMKRVEIPGVPGKILVPIRKGNSVVTQPVCLNGAGVEAAIDPDTGLVIPFYNFYTVYKEKSFASLEINIPF